MNALKRMLLVLLVACLATACAEMTQTTKASFSPVIDRMLARGDLRVGMSGDMPPMNMLTQEDAIIGLDADLAAMIADGMGVRLSIQKIPFAGLLPALEAGTIDMVISNMTITGERNLKAAFVGPYFVSGKAFLTKRSTIANAKKISDLNSPTFTFAALKDSTSQAVIRQAAPQAKLVTAASQNEAIQMVIDGKADALLADYPICIVAVFRNPAAGLVSVVTPITYEPIGIAVPTGDPQLINWLDNYLNTLSAAGHIDGLKERWFSNPDWMTKMK
jgi:polar amino acid transport system substrate-binding protein